MTTGHSNRRHFALGVVLTGVLWFQPVPVVSQGRPKPDEPAQKPAADWVAPKTPWGDPDLQGHWSHGGTPFQTPDPDPVSAAATLKALSSRYGPTADPETGEPRGPIFGSPGERGRPRGPRRKSLVVDPTSGRIPVRPGKFENWNRLARGDHWTNHGAWERCITRGVPNAYVVGSGFEILQSPGWVIMFPEMIHDARFIPMDGRPHVGKGIRLWNGDSRGHWEGDTLVIEVTNFNNQGLTVQEAAGSIKQTEGLKVVERWRRTEENLLMHEVTYDDPNTFSRPWKVELPHMLDPTYQIFEYACHEANRDYMEGSLRQGRLRDQDEAAAKKR